MGDTAWLGFGKDRTPYKTQVLLIVEGLFYEVAQIKLGTRVH